MQDKFNKDILSKNRNFYQQGHAWPIVHYFLQHRTEAAERRGRITRLWQGQLNLSDVAIICKNIKHDDEIPKLFPNSPIVLEMQQPQIFGKEVVSDGESSDDEQNLTTVFFPGQQKTQHRLLMELFDVAQCLICCYYHKDFKQIYMRTVLKVGIIILQALRQNSLQSDPRICLVDERFAVFMQQFLLLVNLVKTQYVKDNQDIIQQNQKIKRFKNQVANYIDTIKKYHQEISLTQVASIGDGYDNLLTKYEGELEQWDKQFEINENIQGPVNKGKGWGFILCGGR